MTEEEWREWSRRENRRFYWDTALLFAVFPGGVLFAYLLILLFHWAGWW
jgi:hypothetical protein